MFLISSLAVVLCLALVDASGVEKDGFKKLNVHDICFEARGDRFGSLYSYVHSGLVGAIKLRYKSGKVRCVSNTAYDSRWGCGQYHSYIHYPLNVVVTDRHNHVIFPKKDYVVNGGLWYWQPFVNDANSDEIVFTDFSRPFYLPQYGQIRIWYGEDLKNWNEGDNQGRVCVDVLAKFV
ncbi:uncharacterized protein LOC110243276 [Exaiptasia diaphana]|uniref:Uncharacterized protein n=1 Tax=Exaiptasia diaphana TaxID=2652724 RepID=A0A913XIP1_EXADI|nr:uncharacterized protein LOC110243276 [Exaiptasia diaphana]KXJ11742.1 hypothetical protein AC249_AIPGENE1535 [Exaiptasia diaphana]